MDGHCGKHDQPNEEAILTTGEYTFCGACADEKIAQNMAAVRAELTAKGYALGEAHADPPQVWLDTKELSA